ncbi:YhdH/YhfP family quinone oxidoreductase [Iodidimonas sp. SYSU 1G8]|uniref:YhdH/YhfP family quinone oxidoreductase n=1 Tax=Iodidimonas sp. SYSU 1G8 TaxID=3133967 RepID=UPI0031FF2E13
MSGTFDAYRIFEDGKAGRGAIIPVSPGELDEGDVLVRTLYAGVNYKDALAGTGRGRIVRRYPCIGGIEAVGIVEQSETPAVPVGATVILHGYGMGVDRDGGLSPWVRVPGAFATLLPEGLNPLHAAAIGVAGHTSALALELMELNGLRPGNGPVAVTGATGGTGSLAVALLAGAGYEVVAVSRKADAADYLRRIGAAAVMAPPERLETAKPLESARWAGAVDTAGGWLLDWLIRTMRNDGVIGAFGNTAGLDLQTSILPFILRGVRLLGVNADTRPPQREKIWDRLATGLNPRFIDDMVHVISLHDLPAFMEDMVAGTTKGRTLVQFA